MRVLLSAFILLFSLVFATDLNQAAEDFAEVYSLAYVSCKTINDNPEAKKEFCEAVETLERSLDNGSPEGLFAIGAYYASGADKLVGKDNFLTFKWLNKAAEKGHAESLKFVGAMCLQGIGTLQDISKGVEYLESAGKKGDVSSYLILGSMYREGKYAPKNLAKAKEYYGFLCNSGEQIGCDLYRVVNEEILFNKNK